MRSHSTMNWWRGLPNGLIGPFHAFMHLGGKWVGFFALLVRILVRILKLGAQNWWHVCIKSWVISIFTLDNPLIVRYKCLASLQIYTVFANYTINLFSIKRFNPPLLFNTVHVYIYLLFKEIWISFKLDVLKGNYLDLEKPNGSNCSVLLSFTEKCWTVLKCNLASCAKAIVT